MVMATTTAMATIMAIRTTTTARRADARLKAGQCLVSGGPMPG